MNTNEIIDRNNIPDTELSTLQENDILEQFNKINSIFNKAFHLTSEQITFIVNIYLNNMDYVRANYQIIMDERVQEYCIGVACVYLNDSKIISFLMDCYQSDFKKIISNNLYSSDGFEFLNCSVITIAFGKNTSLDVIKYLIESYRNNIGRSPNYDLLIQSVFEHNSSFEIIRYVINQDLGCYLVSINTLFFNKYVDLSMDNIKYLVEDYKINIDEETTYYRGGTNGSCIAIALKNERIDDDVINYIINIVSHDTLKNIKIGFKAMERVIKIAIKSTYVRFNIIVKAIYDNFYTLIDNIKRLDPNSDSLHMIDTLCEILEKINPVALNKENLQKCKFDDPFTKKFKDFTKLVDELTIKIDIPEIIHPHEPLLPESGRPKVTPFRDRSVDELTKIDCNELLFIHNNIPYHGNKNIIYQSMLFIGDIVDHTDTTSEPFILDLPVPKYIIDLYIAASYDNYFDLEKIKLWDFKQFIDFIDRYPTDVLSIDRIEGHILNYFVNHNVSPDEWIKGWVSRYRLKYLYLYTHNKKLA